ncbi:TonB-dependent siderophore receptor [Acinetobacter rathckeae]|uniref:TonB-dependent siderophore receptor n=1 Tax=Acinetobacter rathckeae TaxID=2605272 RepID=UPI0018A2CA9D|nr:TonB-dependent siderophore receptor [Acinetobacter rathckeae]MBF7688730.1 TonB-dependent siderophore receptor [Acinetobacter rathckeae]MBF7696123.1 TonB-dependent siderophore receptor [Acinetobacter rathckeae]
MTTFKKKSLYLSVCSILFLSVTHLEAAQGAKDETATLPVLEIKSESDANTYAATKAVSGLKSDTPLFKTAQSVTVVTSEQLNQKQASTLADAISNISGVSVGYRSRRGLDDIIIRGQNASNQIYIDGLRQGTGTDVAVDLSGVDQVQVIKGPASVNFGQVLPGGLVNLVTKRPTANSFANVDLTYGSYDFKQAQFDLNYSPNQSEKGAFRLDGRVADQHDEIEKLYFKNFYISPSYTFDLGDKAELSTIASYQHREYLRIQGIPVLGTLKTNPNGPIQRDIYLGEPAAGPYKADVYRLGYTFKYHFDNAWQFEQNFAVRQANYDGNFITMDRWAGGKTPDYKSIIRVSNAQDSDNRIYTLDNQLKRNFDFHNISHHVLIGVDALHDQRKMNSYDCSISDFNFYTPVYGTNVDCSNRNYRPRSIINKIDTTQFLGLYLRDQIFIKDNLIVSLAGRHDWAKTSSQNLVTAKETKQRNHAFSGSASVLYNINHWVSPYASYSTSFLPNAGTDKNGKIFDPQQGKQLEAGFKFQNESQSLQGSLAWYDLALDNVLVSDTSATGYNIADGQQKTKGIEAEIVANLSDQLRINASFSHMYEAKISKDTRPARVGQRLENTPTNNYSLSTRYYPISDKEGWYIGAGVRGESAKPVVGDTSIKVPSYALFDAEAGYNALHWGAQLSVRNMFDKEYYAGTIANVDNNNRIITLGSPRQINFTLKFKY